jgi:hypothetical protein
VYGRHPVSNHGGELLRSPVPLEALDSLTRVMRRHIPAAVLVTFYFPNYTSFVLFRKGSDPPEGENRSGDFIALLAVQCWTGSRPSRYTRTTRLIT